MPLQPWQEPSLAHAPYRDAVCQKLSMIHLSAATDRSNFPPSLQTSPPLGWVLPLRYARELYLRQHAPLPLAQLGSHAASRFCRNRTLQAPLYRPISVKPQRLEHLRLSLRTLRTQHRASTQVRPIASGLSAWLGHGERRPQQRIPVVSANSMGYESAYLSTLASRNTSTGILWF